ncbi:hypothetical protein LUQ84_001017 [Hamiltosporidium tvaerminnensis]|nr:hypothetical protein LUQ84_001017 [Hamiltosporidium tvaerminnensis]
MEASHTEKFKNFEMSQILTNTPNYISILGRIEDDQAIILASKTNFKVENLLNSLKTFSKSKLILQNDIFLSLNVQMPEEINIKLIHPARESDIKKYSTKEIVFAHETPQMYVEDKLIKDESENNWLFNIIKLEKENKKNKKDELGNKVTEPISEPKNDAENKINAHEEYDYETEKSDTMVYRQEDSDDSDKRIKKAKMMECESNKESKEPEKELKEDIIASTDEFIILPDNKWNQISTENLYLLLIFKDTSLKTIREVTVPNILKRAKSFVIKVLEEKYQLKEQNVLMFFHYRPAYYILHLHIVNIKCPVSLSSCIGRAVLLDDIIDNLENDNNYYKNKTFHFLNFTNNS